MGDLGDELCPVLWTADHVGEGCSCRSWVVEIPATDCDPCLKTGIGRLEICETSNKGSAVVVSRSDGEGVWIEEQEAVIDVRETSHIQVFRRHALTLASVGPRFVVTDCSLCGGGASFARWASNIIASVLTARAAKVRRGPTVSELTAADIERAGFVAWTGIVTALGDGGGRSVV